MLVENIMTAPVLSIKPSSSVGDAAKLMLQHRISGLPVVDNTGAIIGMVSEGDFLRRSELDTERKRSWWLEFFTSPGKIANEYVRSHGRKVEEVMSTEPVTIHRKATLDEAVELMTNKHIKRLPVVDNEKLVGIIARSDLLRAMAQTFLSSGIDRTNDQRIRAAILTELSRQSWGGALIRANVRGGKVELEGSIFDDRVRRAARVAAENVPGVISVTDHLVFIEPMSGTVILPEEYNVTEGQSGQNIRA